MSIYDSTQLIRDDRDLRDIVKEISCHFENPTMAVFPEKPAVYGIFVNKSDCLPAVQFKCSDFVYIGKSSTRTGRGHFKTGRTPSSTLRRTLGAVLKQELRLRTYARGRGRGVEDFTHYRFDKAGEERLTEWMNANLRIGFSVVVNDVDEIEKRLIRYCEPILNLDSWPNLQAEKIKALRKICADEARANGPVRD